MSIISIYDKEFTMERTIFRKISAIVAVIFSLLGTAEGLQVLLGMTQPDYIVLLPLLYYNVTMGIVGIFVGMAIWLNSHRAVFLTFTTIAAHFVVWLIVGVIFLLYGGVAEHSVAAMSLRLIVWLVIAWIILKTSSINKLNSGKI